MRGFDNATPSRGNRQRMSDYADILVWPEKEYKAVRPFGPIFSICNIWISIVTERKPLGVGIPKMCLDHDGYTDKMVTDICPYRKSAAGREGKEYWINVIDREEQEGRDYPALRIRKEHLEGLDYEAIWLKAGDSRKTPVRLLCIPDSQIEKLTGMKKLNKVKGRNGEVRMFDITNEKYGCDLNIMYDPDKKGPAKYDIQKGDRSPLTEDELGYGIYRADMMKPERIEEAKREMENLAGKLAPKKERQGSRDGGGRQRPVADDPLMEDATVRMSARDLEGDDDGYGERRPKRRAAPVDDYEDEQPRRRRAPPSDYEDDEPAPRRRAAPVDLDDDFAEEPAPRRRARPADDEEPAPRRRARDDDEDDRPRRRAPVQSGGRARARVDEDEIPY